MHRPEIPTVCGINRRRLFIALDAFLLSAIIFYLVVPARQPTAGLMPGYLETSGQRIKKESATPSAVMGTDPRPWASPDAGRRRRKKKARQMDGMVEGSKSDKLEEDGEHEEGGEHGEGEGDHGKTRNLHRQWGKAGRRGNSKEAHSKHGKAGTRVEPPMVNRWKTPLCPRHAYTIGRPVPTRAGW